MGERPNWQRAPPRCAPVPWSWRLGPGVLRRGRGRRLVVPVGVVVRVVLLGPQDAQVAGGQVDADGVALLVVVALVVVGDVDLDDGAGGQAHADLVVEAEVDDL